MVTETRGMARSLDAGIERRIAIRHTRHGTLACPRHDLSIGLSLQVYGEHDWKDLEVTRQYATGLVIDAGANIGTHALVYARTAEKVLAFEPQWFIYKLLVMNTVLNCTDNVMPYWCALGQECGMVRIPAYSPDAESIAGGVDVGEGEDLVKIVTLDSLKLEKVSLLKVDVERSMLSVLEGARETIKRDRPVLYVENNFGDEVNAALCAFLREMGYAWQEVIVPAFPVDNFNRATEDIFLSGLTNRNFLCLPEGV